MPRARMIKPEFCDDEKLSTVSRDARLTFISLWIYSDDYGSVKGNHKWLKSKIYPYDDIDLKQFTKWMKELELIDCIRSFDANGESYYYITHFNDHQTINKPSQTRNPTPHDTVLHQCSSGVVALPSEVEIEVEREVEVKENIKDLSVGIPPDRPNGFNLNSLAELWNEKKPPELATVNLPLTRKPRQLSKLKDCLKRNPDPVWWEKILETIHYSSFMRGKNDRGWKATFDFVIDHANEISDGKYIDNGLNQLSRDEKNYVAAQQFITDMEDFPI